VGWELLQLLPTADTDPFVGRELEMAELAAALDAAIEGRGGLTLLAGEPGIGKTRLVEELAVIANDRGVLCAWGDCHESGATPPYWPWAQAIRSLLTDPSEAVLNALSGRAAVIAEIVPEVTNFVPSIEPADHVDTKQARFRLFDSVASFLDEVASSNPLVLVLDDLHGADRSSLDLLEFALRRIDTNPLLVIGIYRNTDLSRRHPFSESLATLARARGVHRIILRGLDRTDIGRMVKAVGDVPLPAQLVNEIQLRTEGNPFFVSEITRDLSRAAAYFGGEFDAVKFRIPEGVRQAIGVRLNRLSEQCNQALVMAAIIGKDFDFTLLNDITDELSEEELLDAVEEALVTGVIRESSAAKERYVFTHTLIQQTLADEISASRRTRLHARIVYALEQSPEATRRERISELAYHAVEAELIVGADKVVHYTRMAGASAAASYAWNEAQTHYRQALDVLGDDAPDADRVEIISGLGQAELFSFAYPDIQRGWDKVALAFDLYVKLGNSQAAVRTAVQSRGYVPYWVHGTARVFSRALEEVPPDTADMGHLLRLYANAIRYEQEDAMGSWVAVEKALDIARETGDNVLEASVLTDQTAFAVYDFDFDKGVNLGLQAIEFAKKTNQPIEEAAAHFYVASSLMALGDSHSAWQHAEAQRRAHGSAASQIGAYFLKYLIAYQRGDLERANELGESLDDLSPGDTIIRLAVGLGAWHNGKTSGLAERIRVVREATHVDPIMHQRSANLSILATTARLLDLKQDAIRAGQMAKSILSDRELSDRNEANVRTAAGLAAVATHDAAEAAEHYQRLKSLKGKDYGLEGPITAQRLLGLLAYTARMPVQAWTHFETALKLNNEAGYRLEEAWTFHDYAEALLDTNESTNFKHALALIDNGLEIVRELGLVAVQRRLVSLQEQAVAKSSTIDANPEGLTPREVEVLRLLADGQTNREIAAELVLSERTVQRHISNVYTKIDVRNRAEATSYALNRLASSEDPSER
jgi:DNA-binding CsgD family transcriptional regulator